MSQRRMVSPKIIDTDEFMDMPMSTQNLYFHMMLRADDDGFLGNPKRIMRLVGANDDDLKVLLTKSYVFRFDSGVCVIRHWRIHNLIRADRYTETFYKEEKAKLGLAENGEYTDIQDGEREAQQKIPRKTEPEWQRKRREAMRNSSLPYSFIYKIQQAFVDKECPSCGCIMKRHRETENLHPTIQHNIPIAKDGKHELGNISVICRSCNVRYRDTETEDFNAKEVTRTWQEITSRQPVGNQSATEVRLGKDRLEKEGGEDKKPATKKATHPSLHVPINQTRYDNLRAEYGEKTVDRYIQKAIDYCDSKGRSYYKDFAASAAQYIRRDEEQGKGPTKRQQETKPKIDVHSLGGGYD